MPIKTLLLTFFSLLSLITAKAQPSLIWATSVGQPYWLKYVSPEAMTLDTAGNIYIAGAFNIQGDFDPGPDTFILNGFASPTDNSC